MGITIIVSEIRSAGDDGSTVLYKWKDGRGGQHLIYINAFHNPLLVVLKEASH